MKFGTNPITLVLLLPNLFDNQAEALDSKPGVDILLDFIVKEDGIAAMRSASLLSSSPPFFNGSPPSRVMNPLIHDVYFADYGKQLPCLSSSPISSPSTSLSPSPSPSPSSSCKGRSCARARLLGQKTRAPARVEGFDCQNTHLVAMA